MSVVIGLAGYKRTGKDTVAARLVEHHSFERFAFADPLKEAALALDPLIHFEQDEAWLWRGDARLSYVVDELGWERAKEIREVRRTLQRFGVGIREILPTFWVDALIRAVESSSAERVVVTDVRFPNEVDAVREQLDGTVALVMRPGTSSDGHVSESLPDSLVPDAVVVNDDSLEVLAQRVDRLASRLC